MTIIPEWHIHTGDAGGESHPKSRAIAKPGGAYYLALLCRPIRKSAQDESLRHLDNLVPQHSGIAVFPQLSYAIDSSF
jgi:hypothetical protein